MPKYVYPAVFTPEDGGMFSVNFPDIENCFTCGNDLAEAIEMASDVLALCLCELEDEGRYIPRPSDPKELRIVSGELVSLILADTTVYRRKLERQRRVRHTQRVHAR